MQNTTTHRVKLLRGYGMGISLKDNQIVLKNGKHFYEKEHEIESYFPSRFPYERIVISGKGMISTESIKVLSEKNVNVILTDSYGNAVSSMNFPMVSGIGSRNRIGQYDTFRDIGKTTYLQRQLLHSKFQSQINFLLSLKEDSRKMISLLKTLQRDIPNLDLRKLVGLEARASREYFKLYSSFFDEQYAFDSRHGMGSTKTKQNATDVINALLNYGYIVLAGEISKQINGLGLDPYYSFYPFKRIIEELYKKRQILKKNKNPLELPIKIILNSMYGKTMQTTENKTGNMFNPVLGTTICGKARAMLYQTIMSNDMERGVIFLYTDSIATTKKLNLDSKELGGFSEDFEWSIYALQRGFYSKNGYFERSRGIGHLGDETIIHKETKTDSKGRLVYEFEKKKVGTLKLNIKQNTLDNIGAFTTVTKKLKLNGDRGRMWWGKLSDVRLKERNISTPFDLSLDDPTKI